MSTVIAMILSAIALVAVMSLGATALEQSLKDLVLTKKLEANEVCVVESVKFNISETACREAKYERIDASFGKATEMIATIKAALIAEEDKLK